LQERKWLFKRGEELGVPIAMYSPSTGRKDEQNAGKHSKGRIFVDPSSYRILKKGFRKIEHQKHRSVCVKSSSFQPGTAFVSLP
jgi:hypothetical protein